MSGALFVPPFCSASSSGPSASTTLSLPPPNDGAKHSDSAALRDMWEAQHARFLPEVLQRKKGGEDIALSGPGSTLAFTARIRVHLREWFERFGVRSIVDVGCGDMTWLPSLNLSGVEYRGFDISRVVVRHNNERFQADARFANRFAVLDLRSQIPPRADMVIARDVLFHLPPAVALAALRNINAARGIWLRPRIFTPRRWGSHRPQRRRATRTCGAQPQSGVKVRDSFTSI